MAETKRSRGGSVRKDLTNQRFEKLTAIRICGVASGGGMIWECRCDCGAIKVVAAGRLRSGRAISCGCYKKSRTRFGLSHTTEFTIWSGMLKRCTIKSRRDYANYGARGITVCERWSGEHGFVNFLSDMGLRPSSEFSIDRIDNDGNYSPDNCRWATAHQQHRNKRNNRIIRAFGQEKPLVEWSEEYGIEAETIAARIVRGASPEEAISKPVGKYFQKVSR